MTSRLALLAALLLAPAAAADRSPVAWPEAERAFFQDGPALLLPPAERARIAALDPPERGREIAAFLATDPLPETAANELAVGVERRQRLVAGELLELGDDRARLLFLRGRPAERTVVECGQVFRPLEIWTYGAPGSERSLLLFRPGPALPFRLWLPSDGKRALYIEEMAYLLEQWEELRRFIVGKRFDLQVCDRAREVERATGIEALTGFRAGRPRDEEIAPFLAPPADLALWARAAAATELPPGADLEVSEVRVGFPAARGQRIVTRLLVVLPSAAGLEIAEEGEKRELRIAVEGAIESEAGPFDAFRARFVLSPPAGPVPLALTVERPLRPGGRFVVRLRVRDEVGGASRLVSRGVEVPAAPAPEADLPLPEGALLALGEEVARQAVGGRDSLLLVPPAEEVVFGLWRAEAIVTGERVRKVVFALDGRPVLTRSAPPWSAELRLANQPVEQLVRAEALDAEGQVVAADELVLNQPQGEPRVTLLAPPRGTRVEGEVLVRAGVVVPEGRRVERVEFRLDDALIATRERPPWETRVTVPAGGEITFLTVTAFFSDGARAEEVRFLNVPRYLEQVEVELVELYVTVTDRAGRPVEGLTAADFTLRDEGRAQPLVRFEQVRDLPLRIGIALDLSGSMQASLAEAKQAAIGLLDGLLTPRDRAFAVGFADRPQLLLPPTPDALALEAAFADLPAAGWTALHDAIVFSLHYFRGVAGRKALVVLSDGDDTASAVPFRDALDFARRSGVVVYTVGLDVSGGALAVRGKLQNLAEETGGRAFFISRAAELVGVYEEIERELRSQYLLAFSPDRAAASGGYRRVEVEAGRGLKARAARGYYP